MSRGKSPQPRTAGQFAYDGLERLFHERARLSILSSLAAHAPGLVFNDLKSLCALTDGNLSRQLQILHDARLVEISKGQHNRRPQTLCKLTAEGRKRFMEYIAELETVVANAAVAGRERKGRSAASGREGLAPAG